jgi:hypothetical protein
VECFQKPFGRSCLARPLPKRAIHRPLAEIFTDVRTHVAVLATGSPAAIARVHVVVAARANEHSDICPSPCPSRRSRRSLAAGEKSRARYANKKYAADRNARARCSFVISRARVVPVERDRHEIAFLSRTMTVDPRGHLRARVRSVIFAKMCGLCATTNRNGASFPLELSNFLPSFERPRLLIAILRDKRTFSQSA